MSMSRYRQPRSRRYEINGNTGRTRGGKLEMVACHAFGGSEGGIITQKLAAELDPIPGQLKTPIRMRVQNVFVPLQAMHELKYPDATLPGNDELIREELAAGNALFGVEPENELSKRANIEPVSVSGVKYVSETVRLAYICAVNHLRRKVYVKANLLDTTRMTPAPAILSQTVLQRLNGVLDPEDRVNGAVNFEGMVPIKGLGVNVNAASVATTSRETQKLTDVYDGFVTSSSIFTMKEDPAKPGWPMVEADLGASGADVTLDDFYRAEMQDRITRDARELVDKYPEYGEAMVTRWAHGLSMEMGKFPSVIYDQEIVFGDSTIRAMDGANLDKLQTNSETDWRITLPVGKSEFGGVVVTLLSILPDETLPNQPHPMLSREWKQPNYIADEMKRDPVPVKMRDINSECAVADEENVMMHIGHNHLKKSYTHYGFNRQVDPTTVENKTAIWQLEIPLSVTPDTVSYPETLDHYPFADQAAEVCTYQVDSVATIVTPLIFGPTPVEELAQIEDDDLFEDQP